MLKFHCLLRLLHYCQYQPDRYHVYVTGICLIPSQVLKPHGNVMSLWWSWYATQLAIHLRCLCSYVQMQSSSTSCLGKQSQPPDFFWHTVALSLTQQPMKEIYQSQPMTCLATKLLCCFVSQGNTAKLFFFFGRPSLIVLTAGLVTHTPHPEQGWERDQKQLVSCEEAFRDFA